MPILVRPLNADEGRIYLEIVNSAIRGLAVRHYAFEGSIALDRLVSGVIEPVPQTGVASPRGLAPFSETDGAKGLVSQIGVAPYTVTGSVVRPAA
jgi:hypothetical protein